MLKRVRSRRPIRTPKPPKAGKPAKAAEVPADKTANMDLMQHITELRKRLFIALAAMVLMTVAALYFGTGLIDVLAKPIGGVDKLVSIEVTENVGVFMRVSLLAGFIASLPMTLYHLIAFLMPGLMPKERRGLLMAIPFATLLFATPTPDPVNMGLLMLPLFLLYWLSVLLAAIAGRGRKEEPQPA